MCVCVALCLICCVCVCVCVCVQENNCAAANADPTCCQYGFTATKGWDATTGLGSVKYPAFMKAVVNLP